MKGKTSKRLIMDEITVQITAPQNLSKHRQRMVREFCQAVRHYIRREAQVHWVSEFLEEKGRVKIIVS